MFTTCEWCQGRGCIACAAAKQKSDAEYRRQFPDGPKPIFTAKPDDPKQWEQLKEIFHADKLKQAFGPGGGGIEEIKRKAKEAMESRDEQT